MIDTIVLRPNDIGSERICKIIFGDELYRRNLENTRITFGRKNVMIEIRSVENFPFSFDWELKISETSEDFDPRETRIIPGLMKEETFSFFIPNVLIEEEYVNLKLTLTPKIFVPSNRDIKSFMEDFKEASLKRIRRDSLNSDILLRKSVTPSPITGKRPQSSLSGGEKRRRRHSAELERGGRATPRSPTPIPSDVFKPIEVPNLELSPVRE